ncbi:hypothetical protein ACIQU5_20825 [Streptomyces sp. NPDC090306]|uniref:hypothetical protein n=1 Tax=Streptomyces sp. NPDC090306 TaxID=3365961 RepID=UPI003813909B
MHLPSGGRSPDAPDSGRLRLLALTGAVVCALALPLAMASAGPVGDGGSRPAGGSAAHGEGNGREGGAARPGAAAPAPGDSRYSAPRSSGPAPADSGPVDDRAPSAGRSPLALGLGLATAARCGPEVASPEGVEAQTCVLTQGEDTWGRAYYRNTTGAPLDAALTLMGPGDRTVRMRCAAGAGDEPAMCETPREPHRGRPADYTAVAEFAAGETGPLLLRSGSGAGAGEGAGAEANSPAGTGS